MTLFELLHGVRPFTANNLFELAVAKSDGTMVAPPRRVPHWLHAAIVRGLSPRPEDRWPSMAALLDELERRPARTRTNRRTLAGLAVAATALAGAMLLARGDDASCDDTADRLAGVVDDDALHELGRTLAAIDTGHAGESAERIGTSLTQWRASWIVERRDACEASVVRGEPSEARIACLEGARRDVAALVGVLREADAKSLARGVAAARSLRDPTRCATAIARETETPELARLDEHISRANAFYAMGRYDDGLATARGVLERARELGNPTRVARAGVALGQIEYELSQREQARATLEDAYFTALGEQDRGTAVEASLLLAQIGAVLGDTDEGMRWIRSARAQLDEDDPERVGRVEHAHATLLGASGAPDEAIAGFTRALELFERVPGTELDVGRELGSIGLELAMAHRSAEAVDYLRRGLAIEERELGPSHPWVALTMGDLAEVERQLGDFAAAEQHFARALAIARASHGDDHWLVAQLQTNFGLFLVGAERVQEALPLLHGALEWYQRNPGPREASGLNNIGHAYATAGDHAAAIPWFERALALGERERGPDDPELTYPLLGLARAQLALGHPELALPYAERGHTRCTSAPLHDTLCATLKVELARALWDTSGDRARARVLAADAERIFAASTEENSEELAEVRAWLREHPASD